MSDYPLHGITVLDLCIVLAGPTCGRTLAQYGAHVIKVDPENRPPQVTPWIDVGRGKQSIVLDLTKPGGLNAFLTLVESADVVIEGFRKGVADKLGIGYNSLKELNPRLVYGSVNCFGQEGPWQLRPGFEQNAQAATGIQLRNGGIKSSYEEGRPRPATFTLNDYGTGISAAYAVMLALLERETTGKGQKIEAALSHTSATITGPYHVDYPGLQRGHIGGPGVRGTGPFNRLYETADKEWLFLSVSGQTELTFLKSIPAFSCIGEQNYDDHMETIFRTKTVAEWLTILGAAAVPAVRNTYAAELHADPFNQERGMVIKRDYSNRLHKTDDFGRSHNWGEVTWPGNPVVMSASRLVEVEPPSFGEDTEKILRNGGLTETDIDNLRLSGAIPETLPINI